MLQRVSATATAVTRESSQERIALQKPLEYSSVLEEPFKSIRQCAMLEQFLDK